MKKKNIIIIDEKICMPVKMQIFICHFVFRRQPADFLFSKKNRQMKAGQILKSFLTWNQGKMCITFSIIILF